MKILFLNGPPGSGKDSLADFLAASLGIRHLKFSAPLKEAAHVLLGLPRKADTYEKEKEQELAAFHGKTPDRKSTV